jgi:hypothetical protein
MTIVYVLGGVGVREGRGKKRSGPVWSRDKSRTVDRVERRAGIGVAYLEQGEKTSR